MVYNKKISAPDCPFNNTIFNGLFNDYYVPLCNYCFKLVKNTVNAEDIVQECFIYLWENWQNLKHHNSLKGYLFKSVRNKSVNYLKDQIRKYEKVGIEEVGESFQISDLPNAIELLENEELKSLLERALNSLPEKCRAIFCLKRFADLSNREIAEKLNISPKTVEAQTTIAIKKLCEYIRKYGDRPSLLLLIFLFSSEKKTHFL